VSGHQRFVEKALLSLSPQESGMGLIQASLLYQKAHTSGMTAHPEVSIRKK
jgi:hypothetical protein